MSPLPRLPRRRVATGSTLVLVTTLSLVPLAAGANPVAEPAVDDARSASGETAPARSEGGSRASSHHGRDGDSAMTLDAITIEGEIDVPQVLFITAREDLRAPDSMMHLYLVAPATLLVAPFVGSGVDASTARPPLRDDAGPGPQGPVPVIEPQPEE